MIHITDTKKNTKSILTVTYIDKEHNEARLQLSEHDGHVKRDFTIALNKAEKMNSDVTLHLASIAKYKSDARDVEYVCIGFDADRHINIKGEWRINGNK